MNPARAASGSGPEGGLIEDDLAFSDIPLVTQTEMEDSGPIDRGEVSADGVFSDGIEIASVKDRDSS